MNDGHINASMDIDNASLDVTFGEVYEIDKGMPAAIIANLYSSQSTYSPGDYVIYRNKLYKCLVAIETPEEFNTEKWELVKVAEELKEKADKSSTYTKTEVDTALASKAAADSVYTKVETDNLVKNSNLIIANKFDENETYYWGSFVIYEGELYILWEDEFSGPFDPEVWSKYTVTEYVSEEFNETKGIINTKMTQSNPTGTGALSINRKANTTVGEESTAFGYNPTASGEQSIAGGYNATASNTVSVALGNGANALGFGATAFGTSTRATGSYSQAEGYQTRAAGGSSHAEGNQSYASGGVSHAEGYSTQASGQYSHVEGNSSIAEGSTSHAEGYSTTASGNYSHTEGCQTIASAHSSHAEGLHTQATQNYSHSEGCSTVASGSTSHAEGYETTASGQDSHAEGYKTTASGYTSHAEGNNTTASYAAHAEGGYTVASGDNSHAEGYETIASGDTSHSEGFRTIANHKSQHVFGEYNIKDNSENEQYDRGNYVEIVGNGYWDSEEEEAVCSNARTLDWSGNEVLAGDLTYNGNKSLTSEISRLDGKIDNLPAPMIFKGTLGVSGTIQSLPTASASNEGFTYKVITDGTYAGQTAKVGDIFTSNGSSWVLIPSGDEGADTWRAIKINGTEKLANGISSGDVDFVNTDNIEVTFDTTGNKVKIATKNIYTQTQVDTALSNKLDKSNPTGTGSLSLNRKSGTDIGTNSVAVGNNTEASGEYSFAEGTNTVASSYNAHAEGNGSVANDTAAHAEGIDTTASYAAHAEGEDTVASGDASHAEGETTTASGRYAHSEGEGTTASGYAAHAEGKGPTASGEASHAEGCYTIASGNYAHAEGSDTTASGEYSHAQGFRTIAGRRSQNVFGEFNEAESGSAYSKGTYVEIVGNGTTDNDRSNARTLDWSGNEMIAGDLTFNGDKSLTNEIQRIDGKIDNLPVPMIFKGTLGVNGTISSLPGAGASNEGYTYKVITDGTYASQSARAGDVFTSNGSEWILIPAGDTDTDTWRAIKVNGTEKLGSGISSGAVDFCGSANVDVTFDADGNKIEVATKNIYTQTQVDTALANKADKNNPVITGALNMNKSSAYSLGSYATTLGYMGRASGQASTSIGMGNQSTGSYSTSIGYGTVSAGLASTSIGDHTDARSRAQLVFGRYNILDTSNTYIEIVGNGIFNQETFQEDRSNARTLDWQGNEWLAGDLIINESVSVATMLSNMASDYNSSSTYNEGDCVIYQNVLYQCNTSISVAEQWTPAHWTQVKLAEVGGGGGGASWVDVTGTLVAGQTSVTLQDASITTNSTIEVFTEDGTEWNTVTVATGSVTVTFDVQQNNLGVKVRVT